MNGIDTGFGPIKHYACIGSVSLLAVLTVFILQDAVIAHFHAIWQWNHYHYGNDVFKKRFVAGFLPAPFAFLLWLRMLERNGRFKPAFSPIAAILSIASFAAILLLQQYPERMLTALGIGVIAGLFIFLPFRAWLRRALAQKRLALVALIAMSAAWDYYWLMGHPLSHTVLSWTLAVTTDILQAMRIDVFADENLDFHLAYNVMTPQFKVILAPFCGGLEGMFLFLFLLSILLLYDWPRFMGRRLAPYYVLGALVMFGLNALRVALLFALGHFASAPGAPVWLAGLRGAPFALFHSYIGWFLDMGIFTLLAVYLYRSTPPNSVAR